MTTNTSSANNNKPTYPNPIPPPRLDLTFPNHAAAATYLHGFAADHGFEITTLDTRLPTSIKYKCSLGDHRHLTKAKREAKDPQSTQSTSTAQQTQSTSTTRPLKTCLFKIISRRNRKDHNLFYLTFQEECHRHHNHGPQEGPPKKILFIPSLSQPQPTSSFPAPAPQLPTISSAILDLSSAGLLTHQYRLLLQEMQSLPTPNQAYLLNSFLRDVEFAKGIASSTTLPPIQPRRTPYPVLLSTSAESAAEAQTAVSKGTNMMTEIPKAPTLSSPAPADSHLASSIPNLQVSPLVHQDVIDFTIQSLKSPSPDSPLLPNQKTRLMPPKDIIHSNPGSAPSNFENPPTETLSSPLPEFNLDIPKKAPQVDTETSKNEYAAGSGLNATENRSSPLPEFNLDIPMKAPQVDAEPFKNEDAAGSGLNATDNCSSPLPELNHDIPMESPQLDAEPSKKEDEAEAISGLNEKHSSTRSSSPLPELKADLKAPDVEAEATSKIDDQVVSGGLPLPDQAKVRKTRTRKRKITHVEENPAPIPNLRTRKGQMKEPDPNVRKRKPTTNPTLPKLPKGYGYIEVPEQVESTEPHASVPTEEKDPAVGRGRKRKGRPIPPPKVSTRRQVAAPANQEVKGPSGLGLRNQSHSFRGVQSVNDTLHAMPNFGQGNHTPFTHFHLIFNGHHDSGHQTELSVNGNIHGVFTLSEQCEKV
ncbi:hypothetical protein DFH28DRAFT_931488 [Melampsora americana]|nr:hypothetical protein DFH28DRAFT_931488 [Melampsora americana]